MIGEKIERWTVIGLVPAANLRAKSRAKHWLCRCECGTSAIVRQDRLMNGKSQSCGCLRSELTVARETQHGHARGGQSPTYQAWLQMLGRCNNPSDRLWHNYGARGITVCERWRHFENFIADMGERPEGLTLRRLDPDKGYCVENCQWAPRLTKNDQKWGTQTIMCDGAELPLSEAARLKGISIALLRYRLAAGWPPDKALQPAQPRKQRTHALPPVSIDEATGS